MSWSVNAFGRPKAVKAKLKEDFAALKPGLAHIPHEHASAALTEEIIDAQLNFLIENEVNEAVKVQAGGHAWLSKPNGSTATSLSFEIVHGFVD